jgi:hypothetical protein
MRIMDFNVPAVTCACRKTGPKYDVSCIEGGIAEASPRGHIAFGTVEYVDRS